MPNIEMIPVVSSNVESIGYDEGAQTLQIRFLNGSTYIYLNVPLVEFEQVKMATSVGAYLNRNIKGIYPYQRVG